MLNYGVTLGYWANVETTDHSKQQALLAEARAVLTQLQAVRKRIGSSSEYYELAYPDMWVIYNTLSGKQAEKYIEGWVAHLLKGNKLQSQDIPEDERGHDYGDIWVGPNKTLGYNNAELKVILRDGGSIGGKQFRFYENVPYYLFFKAWSPERYELFMLTARQLVDEIKYRGHAYPKLRAYGASQGTGWMTRTTPLQEKLDRLDMNLLGKNRDLITWEFNAQTETEYYERFQKLYSVSPEQALERIYQKALT